MPPGEATHQTRATPGACAAASGLFLRLLHVHLREQKSKSQGASLNRTVAGVESPAARGRTCCGICCCG